MWSAILGWFEDSPSQTRVVRFLLENGFGVNQDGKIACNTIAVAATQVAAKLHVDRRVVEATARRILTSPFRDIFINMRATPDLSVIAESLSLSVITVIPQDASRPGIVDACIHILSSHNIGLRQVFVTDPHLSEEPRLVIIAEGKMPPGVIDELRELPVVKRLIL
ncbi:regulator of amino acid metabolism, contains ACT domain protein [Methanospirillum hungatei]|jgi:Predicted regulator of amino acid metabolism, contains ACT domain|nr:regulator of amino acid metabolism, contains ACT domain protein [Methanospirillum hungatei]MBP7034469.1 regulator of amino acid metabolism, contains ACT domain protein [Methanospirillum sp.]MBP9009215.1 regulator of amino acid metabolism, contains ACT domain protein [Methanospirillum sp.]MCA1917087.1 regulator of amino acid metabolism, contains ACT domain protein [Methanospirillum hungatei]HOW04632.1 regulator of amino acid metabolism, contains ACT domain protein [Methanospirillum hungatei]